MDIIALIAGFADKFPIIATVLMVVGALRVINKPLFAVARALVAATPADSDDKILDSVEQSKVYQVFSFILDWSASVKLPSKK